MTADTVRELRAEYPAAEGTADARRRSCGIGEVMTGTGARRGAATEGNGPRGG